MKLHCHMLDKSANTMAMTQPVPINAAAAYRAPSAFGLTFDGIDVVGAARLIAAAPGRRNGRARIFITPNIQHIAEMRRRPELYHAIREADLVTADGFPLAKYARLSGCHIPGRVTGRDVVEELMLRTQLGADHKMFFLIDSVETAEAVHRWAAARSLSQRVIVEVAPQRFGEDQAASAALARRVREAGTTILFLGLGAPKCELFASRFRNQLGDCWALCIGQSVRVALGIVQTPPAAVVKLHMEWAWRIMKEPRRLIGRYVSSAIGFSSAIVEDQLEKRIGRPEAISAR